MIVGEIILVFTISFVAGWKFGDKIPFFKKKESISREVEQIVIQIENGELKSSERCGIDGILLEMEKPGFRIAICRDHFKDAPDGANSLYHIDGVFYYPKLNKTEINRLIKARENFTKLVVNRKIEEMTINSAKNAIKKLDQFVEKVLND